MLKIPKGLKKKKKGKKSKRKGEEEIFTEEELEKYRREHQAQPQQPEVQLDSDQEQSEKAKSDKDEWSKFNALTTGVDSILKKTQGDLDRIKSTSFFQRVPEGPKSVDHRGKNLPLKRDAQKDGQRWIGFEEKKESGETQPKPQQETVKFEEVPQASVEFVVSETESEEDDFDDIFDTSYVEAVEKGEVKLAYIPDSPEDELDEGPDPFDTSYADKVIRGPEVSKKGKKLVNIGVAVEVLTGRLDSVNTSAAAVKKAKRRIPQDLLFESVNSEDIADAVVEETVNTICLLDDDTENFEDVPVDLSISLHTQYIQKSNGQTGNSEDTNKDILNVFDTINKSDEDEDDEFAKLASESLSKPSAAEVSQIPFVPAEPVTNDSSWAAFEDSKPKPARPPPPRPVTGPSQIKTDSDLILSPSVDDDNDGPDPFDTTFAENILPGKAELKNLEEELLNSNTTDLTKSDSDFDFNPREEERAYINNRRKSSVHIHITDPTGIRESISELGGNAGTEQFDTLKQLHRDLLGGSSTDLSQLADSPIAPSGTDDNGQLEYSDPFDTSIVNFISAPGKTELKFIENELLGESEIKRSVSDPDFDPRAEEFEDAHTNISRKASRPENLLVAKTVIFKIPPEGNDFLSAEKGGSKKPVTPYYAREASITDEEVDTLEDLEDTEDTFDVSGGSFTGSLAKPNQSILKNSQETILLTRSTSDQDLNNDEDDYNEKSFSQLRRHSDFPVNFSKTIDFANLAKKSQTKKTDFLSISEEESFDTKVLTPFQENKGSFDQEIDPFDTSIISNILLPGKTELKVLESELLSKDTAASHLFDPDFDPRAEENTNPKNVQDFLAPSDDAFQAKALTPEIPDPVTGFLIGTEDDDIDPFDTSIAENLVPGKTELKLLESELMN